LRRELVEVQRERDEYRARLNELSAAVLERTKAYFELRHLQRERDIARARAAERDPNATLN